MRGKLVHKLQIFKIFKNIYLRYKQNQSSQCGCENNHSQGKNNY